MTIRKMLWHPRDRLRRDARFRICRDLAKKIAPFEQLCRQFVAPGHADEAGKR